MKRSPSSRIAPVVVSAATGSPLRLKVLAGAAFVLLAAAMTVRPILGEMWTVEVRQLIDPSPLWWNTCPAVMYISHLVAAAGLLLGALWVVLKRQPWRFTGLEPAIALLILAAVLSVPAASDKRLAINVAIGTILPMAVAAVLVQMLAGRSTWRRALLAALIAAAVANCWRGTHQQIYEFEQTRQYYLENKVQYWARQGKSIHDPMVQPEIEIYEARLNAHQPLGYFYHPNVLASFLLLGIAVAGAAATGTGFAPHRLLGRLSSILKPQPLSSSESATGGLPARAAAGRSSSPPSPGIRSSAESPVRRIPWAIASLIALLAMIAWCLIVVCWVGSMGAKAGIVVGTLTGLIFWVLRRRPGTAGLLCLAILAVLQVSLVVLASRADTIVPPLVERGGKFKSLAFRLDYWHGAMEIFAQHPITGVGPGQFGKAYPSVKPIRAAEEVAHPHNWLLNMAAEWGIFGLLGTVTALVLPAWLLLRPRRTADHDAAAPSSGDVADDGRIAPDTHVLLLTWATVCLCWLILLWGIVPAGSEIFLYMTRGLPYALVAAAIAGIPSARGPAGRVILLAGWASFVVHATVEMSSAVPGAIWPFWATVALAMAWSGGAPAQEPGRPVGWLALRRPAFVLAAIGSLAVLVLSVNPLRGIWDMSQAKNTLLSARGIEAEASLRAAAEADRLDPAPQEALGMFYLRVAQANPKQAVHYLQQAVQSARVATDRDPASHTLWHDLAWTTVELARATQDSALAQQAIEAMRRSVRIYPNYPRGHLKLATLLGTASEPPDCNPVLLKEALAEYDTALRLNEGWPSDSPFKFDEKDLAGLRAGRQRTLQYLQDTPASHPAPGSASGR